MKSFIKTFALAIAIIFTGSLQAQTATMVKHDKMSAEPTVIKLSQTPGAYTIQSLELVPGDYIFEITNENVDHPVAFFLTTAEDQKTPIDNSLLEGGVAEGNSSRSGVVHLTAGNYKYSCPMNPTEQYSLTVKQ